MRQTETAAIPAGIACLSQTWQEVPRILSVQLSAVGPGRGEGGQRDRNVEQKGKKLVDHPNEGERSRLVV